MPWNGAGSIRANGLEVKTAKARNNAPSPPCTPIAEVFSPNGSPLARVRAAPNPVMTRHHRTSDPSWLPQAAATL